MKLGLPNHTGALIYKYTPTLTTKELAGIILVPIPSRILDIRNTLLNNFNGISGSILGGDSKAFGMRALFRVLGFRALGVRLGVWGIEVSLLGWNPQTRTSSLQTCGGDSSGNYAENALNTRILSSGDLRRRRYPERIL